MKLLRAARCFFTGHRIISNDDKEFLFERIKNLVSELEEKGIYEFYAGGALGFDYIASKAVIEVKKKKPHICLRLLLPCYGSEKKWHHNQKYEFQMLKVHSDSIEYVSEEKYYDGCMQKRNITMAEQCGTCIAFCKNERSGTKKTMDYAESVGCLVINLAEQKRGK